MTSRLDRLRALHAAAPHIYGPCPKHREYFGIEHRTPIEERECSCRSDYLPSLLACVDALRGLVQALGSFHTDRKVAEAAMAGYHALAPLLEEQP